MLCILHMAHEWFLEKMTEGRRSTCAMLCILHIVWHMNGLMENSTEGRRSNPSDLWRGPCYAFYVWHMNGLMENSTGEEV